MDKYKNVIRIAAWFACFVMLIPPGASFAQAHAPVQVLHIGILPISTTRTLIKNYQPLRIYLERELKRPVELHTAHDFRTFHFNTAKGDYDLIITASHLGRIAETDFSYIPLARYKAPHRTLLIVARDQPLKSIQDLRGKVVAGIDPIALAVNETVLWLKKQGLNAGVDYTLLETNSPVSAAYSVQNHQSAMAISSPQGIKQLPDNVKANIEVFASLPELPSLLWLAHPRMHREISGIKAALIHFSDQSEEGAEFYKATGYAGMREIGNGETLAMDELAHEAKVRLEQN